MPARLVSRGEKSHLSRCARLCLSASCSMKNAAHADSAAAHEGVSLHCLAGTTAGGEHYKDPDCFARTVTPLFLTGARFSCLARSLSPAWQTSLWAEASGRRHRLQASCVFARCARALLYAHIGGQVPRQNISCCMNMALRLLCALHALTRALFLRQLSLLCLCGTQPLCCGGRNKT